MRSRYPALIASPRFDCLVQEAVYLDIQTGVLEQGWQDLPFDLLACVVAQLSKRDHKAVSLVCKRWKQVSRQQAAKAAVSDISAIQAVLASFPKLVELHINTVQDAIPVQAVQAIACHTSIRSLQLNSCSAQPALLEALAATSRLQELHLLADRRPGRSAFTQLQFLPGLKALSLDGIGLTRRQDVLQHTGLTKLALIHQLQLPAGLLTGLTSLTALRSLDFTSCKGSQPTAITDASISSVLPSLTHLTYLSLAGCSDLHISCLNSVSTSCTQLQHLNVDSLERSGDALHPPNGLTHLDISNDRGAAALYTLPPGLRHLVMQNTRLGDIFARHLLAHCPQLHFVDARGCGNISELAGIHELVHCGQMQKVVLDGSCLGANDQHMMDFIMYWMLRRAGLRLTADMGCDGPWSLEPLTKEAFVLVRQATMRLRDRGVVCFALLLWGWGGVWMALWFLPVLKLWMGLFEASAVPRGGPNDIKHFLFALSVWFSVRQTRELRNIMLGFALTPGITAHPWVRRYAESRANSEVSFDAFMGRWLISPAFKRIRNKPSTGRVVLLATALWYASWLMLSRCSQMVQMLVQALPFLPYPVVVLVLGLYILYIVYMCLMCLFFLGWVCSVAVLLG